MIEIIGIKTNDGYYITDNLKNESYFSSQIKSKIINSEPVESTFHNSWFKINGEPKTVQQYEPQPPINRRYELKDNFLSDKLKDMYLWDDVFVEINEDYENVFIKEFSAIFPLYEYKEDKQLPILKDVEFTYRTLTEIDEIKTPSTFSYKRVGQWNHEKYPPATEKDLEFDMISKIITPALLLPSTPCSLNRKATYDIIRAYVKENINPKVAEITSDYDFCFTVKKKIDLAKEHKYEVDVNNSIFSNKKRKPKYETRLQKSRSVQVFEMCHAPYQGYTSIEPFKAENQDDLKTYIDNYLDHLIKVINEPLCECDKCNGTGVLIKNN